MVKQPKKLTIYSKQCVSCFYAGELNNIKAWAGSKGIDVVVKRTVLNPFWHNEAKKYRHDYETFVVYGNRDYDFTTFLKIIKQKEVEYQDDLQGLRKATKSGRVRRVAGKKNKAKKGDGESVKK